MSYSRWGNSHWYTFWLAQEDEDYDTATFCICSLTQFKAITIREQFDECINIVRSMDEKASDAEINELRGYMRSFLEEVDSKYKN